MTIRMFMLAVATVLVAACGSAETTTTGTTDAAPAFAVRNVTVIDGTGAPAQPGMTVVVTGTRITGVGRDIEVPQAAQVVDGTGKYMIPGLWDMHIHIHRWDEFPLLLANGVTGVRLMAGLPEYFKMVEAIEAGRAVGPRMAIASRNIDGRIPEQPLPPAPGDTAGEAEEFGQVERGESIPRAVQVTNRDEARTAMAQAKASGVEFVKIHNELTRDAYFAIAEEARQQGLYLTGHMPTGVSLAELSDSGMRSIEHFSGFLEGCSTREDELLRLALEAQSLPPAERGRANVRIQRLAVESFSAGRCRALAERFVKNQTWLSPTFMPGGGMRADRDRGAAAARYIPAALRARWIKAAEGARPPAPSPDQQAVGKLVEAKQREIVGIMKEAGVQFVIGTDTGRPWRMTGFNMHEALEETVRAGLTPMEAITAATASSARLLRRDGQWGTIEPNKLADLVLLDANPLDQIGNTRRINAVVINGRLLDRQALDAMLAELEKANAN